MALTFDMFMGDKYYKSQDDLGFCFPNATHKTRLASTPSKILQIIYVFGMKSKDQNQKSNMSMFQSF